jgi:hypothetical protein
VFRVAQFLHALLGDAPGMALAAAVAGMIVSLMVVIHGSTYTLGGYHRQQAPK